jgi:PleD family two-component response regulator
MEAGDERINGPGGAEGAGLARIMDKDAFLRFLDLEVKRAWRYQNFLCLLVIEIKQCSDDHGGCDPQICCEILSDLLRVEMRESDILAFLGLSQMAILLPYADKAAGDRAKVRLENTLKYYEFRKRGYEVEVRQICFPMDGTSIKDLMKRVSEEK